jgi:uncharacterized protein YkwD
MNMGRRISHTIAVFCLGLAFFSISQKADASVMSDLSSGITNVVRFISHDFLAGLRNSFCDFYLSEVQSGIWKNGSLRANIGGSICANYTPPQLAAATSTSTELAIPVSDGPSALPSENPVSTLTPQTNTPGAYVGDINASGNVLNAGEIMYWTNIERQKNGTNLSSLSDNATLDEIARIRVQDMFAKQYFAHVSPTGDNVSKEADSHGYDFITIGENIALGNFGSSRGLVEAWMNSPGHRANILNTSYKEIGVYAMEGTYQGQTVWIAGQVFGKSAANCASPDSALKSKINSEKYTLTQMETDLAADQTALQNMDKTNLSAYNAKVSEYNQLAKNYNDLVALIKSLIATYNSETDTYNTCIKNN